MQVIIKNKYLLFISILILINFSVSAQNNIGNNSVSDTLIVQTDSTKTRDKFSFSNLFKHKNKSKNKEALSDTSSYHKKKFTFKNLFKHKRNKDSTITEKDSLTNDSSQQKKRFTLFKKNKKDTSQNIKGTTKPHRITPGFWLKMNANEQDSLLRAWDDYDRVRYLKKYTNSSRIKKMDMKRDKNFIEKLILKNTAKKPYKYQKKIIYKKISRYRKTMIYELFDKSDTSPDDSLSDIKKYQIVNKQFKRKAKQEAIRKNKISLKYDKKENRLRRRYTLSENEGRLLYRGKAMPLKGTDRIVYRKAKKKQTQFSEKLLKLRKKRSFALQNKEIQKKMRAEQKRIAQRDKKENKKQHKKKKNKERNKKHDSSEYPKRYFK